MAKKKTTNSKKARYQLYQIDNRSLKNRTNRMHRHLKNHPNDKQAHAALNKGLVSYRRKTPRTYMWSKQDIEAVQLFIAAGCSGKEYLELKNKLKN